MEVPILKQGPYLIASVQSALNDADLRFLRDNLVERVGKMRARGVIVDVTALGLMLEGVATALDLEEGLEFLNRKARVAEQEAGKRAS